jgi:hypothetical protein
MNEAPHPLLFIISDLILESLLFYIVHFSFQINKSLKVHKIEHFFGSDFDFCVISFLVMLKY